MKKNNKKSTHTTNRPESRIIVKSNGKALTIFGHSKDKRTDTTLECTSSVFVNGREFIVTDVFPLYPTSTPTAKLKAYIDLKNDAT